MRLTEYGHNVGLINNDRYNKFLLKKEAIKNLIKELKTNKINPTEMGNNFLRDLNTAEIKDSITLYDLLKRPEIKIYSLKNMFGKYSNDVLEQVEISVKYEGYIKKALKDAEKFNELDSKKIPSDIDYSKIKNLASEAKQKLEQVRPTSLAQALRISGVNPSDISVIMVYLKKEYNNDNK